MTTCLVLGGADTLVDDLAAYDGPVDGVVACNDAGTAYGGDLTAWASIHVDNFARWTGERRALGFPDAGLLVAHQPTRRAAPFNIGLITSIEIPGHGTSGNSGLFAIKVALVDLGFDDVVLCGLPLTPTPHLDGGKPWKHATGYQAIWATIPAGYAARIRSMSGWTREHFGGPEDG